MGKILDCVKVDPASSCTHVIRGNTEDELPKNAMDHAKQHSIYEVMPNLMARMKAAIWDEP